MCELPINGRIAIRFSAESGLCIFGFCLPAIAIAQARRAGRKPKIKKQNPDYPVNPVQIFF
jgi:hypothetical protein